VLPIGGLKEKLLAAHRGGIETVLIPKENERDLVDIPKNIKQHLDIRPVRWIDEVLQLALTRMPVQTIASQSQEEPLPDMDNNVDPEPSDTDTITDGLCTHH
jgi:ATP-dependent Lon protease